MKRTKESRKRIGNLILLIAFTSVLLISSIYAWFTTQRDVTITNLSGKVEVAESLEISIDAKNWSQIIDLNELSLRNDAWSEDANKLPSDLVPVSTDGTIVAGTQTELNMYTGTLNNSIKLNDIKTTEDKYYAFDIFLRDSTRIKPDEDAETATRKLQLGIGSFVNFVEAGDQKFGIENSVRVGFALMDATVPNTEDSQSNILAALTSTSGRNVYIKDVAIWEPNCEKHVDNIVTNNNRVTLPITKWTSLGVNSPYKFKNGTQLPTYAIKNGTETGTSIPNVWDWKYEADEGDEGYTWANASYLKLQNTVQTTGTTVNDLTDLKSSNTPTNNFEIPSNKICRIRVYVWLEGQDVDSTNWSSLGEGIDLNLVLEKPATQV